MGWPCRDGVSHWVERPTEKPGVGSSPQRGTRFLSQGQLSVQTLLRCPYSPRVQSLASRSVRELKTPDTGSHTIGRTHENTAHPSRNRWRCSRGCRSLNEPRRGRPRISRKGSVKEKQKSKCQYMSSLRVTAGVCLLSKERCSLYLKQLTNDKREKEKKKKAQRSSWTC